MPERDLDVFEDTDSRPVLLLDVDGVISLFGFDVAEPPPGQFISVEGIGHLISGTAGPLIAELEPSFEIVWATGWEEKANDHLPALLGINGDLHVLSFDQPASGHQAHWKLSGIERHVGADRPVAWIDDNHTVACRRWADERPGPTLLVTTQPETGITEEHVELLKAWARSLQLDQQQ